MSKKIRYEEYVLKLKIEGNPTRKEIKDFLVNVRSGWVSRNTRVFISTINPTRIKKGK